MKNLVLLVVVAILAVSCASTEDICKKGNWEGLGYKEAMRGNVAQASLDSWNARCSEFSIQVDKNAFMTGHNNGKTNYCTTANAYKQGERYNSNFDAGICSSGDKYKLNTANTDGKTVNYLNKQLDELDGDYKSLQEQLKTVKTNYELNEIRREKTRIDRERRSIERQIKVIELKYN